MRFTDLRETQEGVIERLRRYFKSQLKHPNAALGYDTLEANWTVNNNTDNGASHADFVLKAQFSSTPHDAVVEDMKMAIDTAGGKITEIVPWSGNGRHTVTFPQTGDEEFPEMLVHTIKFMDGDFFCRAIVTTQYLITPVPTHEIQFRRRVTDIN